MAGMNPALPDLRGKFIVIVVVLTVISTLAVGARVSAKTMRPSPTRSRYLTTREIWRK
ncbi:hypothetical protein P154DRAFT_581870 [Amniculicola lignicola CBS 123094]|uniref:Uncharacterized protein n=1 Tax=Amniculicola lignicola CBS 123094 TaxID=1392246 RepID=A0A6A5VZF3_9PLEO|nr:hypothetical protein P154DRAFT_581870 [Amniculicola lignicola CBS 123094]